MLQRLVTHSGRWLLLMAVATWVGCSRTETTEVTTEPAGQAAHDDHDHAGHDDHGHGDHEMGPHGGHMVHLEPSGAHAEWVHLDSEELVQVFVDEAVGATAVAMEVTVAGQEPKRYELEAADGDLGAGAYQLKSSELLVDIKMGEAAAVQLVVETAEGTQQAAIEHHEH